MLSGTVKSYQVWGKLSHGGMADVFLARHVDLALPVVVKTLRHLEGESFAERWTRLLTEARLAARLTSARVVRVIDVGVAAPGEPGADRAPFLVEEYVDGVDLAELDRRRRQALRRPLPLWLVADYLAQAAEGLNAAHQTGVLHRDVKPSNLFGYGHGQLKVGDFGVAVASWTQGSPPAGTPLYMAPEQLEGDRIDRRADIYSLGATAYALRYGQAPFASLKEVTRPDSRVYFPAARSPEEAFFQHVVARMLARRPEHRYAHLTAPKRRFQALARETGPRTAPVRIRADEFRVGDTRVLVEVGDIARARAEGIVNSANTRMAMRLGVSEALRAAGGDAVEAEAMRGGERALGDCLLTAAGALPCRGIIHAVAAWNEVSCIARATQRAFLMAEEQGYRTLALPALGTGQGRVGMEACADSMVSTMLLHLLLGGSGIREVRFVLYDAPSYARFLEVAAGLLVGDGEATRHGDDADAEADEGEALEATLLGSTPPPERER